MRTDHSEVALVTALHLGLSVPAFHAEKTQRYVKNGAIQTQMEVHRDA